MKMKIFLSLITLSFIIVIGYKIKSHSNNSLSSSRNPSSKKSEVYDSRKTEEDSSRSSFFDFESDRRSKAERQEDMNIICRSRAAVKIAADSYDDYIWKCNHPPYGVVYTDCSQ